MPFPVHSGVLGIPGGNDHGKHPYRPRLAAVAALPFAAALFTGVAHGGQRLPSRTTDRTRRVATIVGSGVGGDNYGNSTTTQQLATGAGASNQNNTAQVNGSGVHGHRPVEREHRDQLHSALVSARPAGVLGD